MEPVQEVADTTQLVCAVIATPRSHPHEVVLYSVLEVPQAVLIMLENMGNEVHRCSTKQEATTEAGRIMEEATRDYTTLLRDPAEMEKAKKRPFCAWISADITPYPGLYRISKSEFDQLGTHCRLPTDEELSQKARTLLVIHDHLEEFHQITGVLPPNLLIAKMAHPPELFPQELDEEASRCLPQLLQLYLQLTLQVATEDVMPLNLSQHDSLRPVLRDTLEEVEAQYRNIITECKTWGLRAHVMRNESTQRLHYKISVISKDVEVSERKLPFPFDD